MRLLFTPTVLVGRGGVLAASFPLAARAVVAGFAACQRKQLL
jgi:hypothetical protein